MTTFDFMSDISLRNSLENDYYELEKCMKSNAWKAVHVLAGSIIETLLLDYLIETEYSRRTSTDLKNIRFVNMINICKNEGVLTNKSAELSHVIREYRNLIHPERTIRINETVDENSATVAQALVRMIVEEISTKRRQTYGYTAEQIIKKIESDSSVSSILTYLLKNTKENEKRQLLLTAIPQKYLSLNTSDELSPDNEGRQKSLTTLTKCYRQTFDIASDETKKAVTEQFLKIIKEESTEIVKMYELEFFKGTDLVYYSPHDIQIITKHILSTLESVPVYEHMLDNLQGISIFLELEDIVKLIDIIIKEFVNTQYAITSAKYFLDAEYQNLPQEAQNKIKSRLTTWRNAYRSRGNTENAEEVQKILDYLELESLGDLDDHPF
ncbi:hypothetical protein KSF_054690 [Reticulibacter mediterranei]|uniref:DUF4145 domain-containing protein n=1 Tax=Reticulibacter mediterranei TaxID=2778369 RepID=A0A8J3IUB4_9CHLR|nr:hypothetical protein [Reticulibacter mediterranei]GHO95421.1 hypothetical protein KSF_054690 [Reticulibacter mediterranei]